MLIFVFWLHDISKTYKSSRRTQWLKTLILWLHEKRNQGLIKIVKWFLYKPQTTSNLTYFHYNYMMQFFSIAYVK